MNDMQAGQNAMRVFWEYSKRFPGAPSSFAEFYSLYGKKADIYADGLGMAIRVNNMPERQVIAAMENLAIKAQGQVPKDHNAYFAAISGEAGKISYLDLTKTVVADVASDVVAGAQSLGDNLIGVLKVANFVLPFALIYFGYLYLKKTSGKFK